MQIVNVDLVSYKYNSETVLDDVSFKIEEGDFLGIVGPNGAGKTTLFQCMLGLLNDYSGKITIFGQDIKKNREVLKKIGYIPQKKFIDPRFPLTVKELVLLSTDKKSPIADVDEILNQVGLYQFKNRIIGELSGGQQQRVLIAKALINKPKILMLDEPTNELDQNSQDNFYAFLKKLNEDQITIIWASHDLDAVNQFANKVSCINKKMFFHGKKDEFFSNEDNMKKYSESTMQIHMHTHDL